MAKFSKDDKVRVVKGECEGLVGVVVDPWWQISQSDWPCVEFLTDAGMYVYEDEDNMELAEDPYEYAMQVTSHGKVVPNYDREWGTLEVAQERHERYTESWERLGRSSYLSAKVVKRRKAGKVEDV